MLSMLSSEKLSRLYLLKKVEPSPDGKMVKLLLLYGGECFTGN